MKGKRKEHVYISSSAEVRSLCHRLPDMNGNIRKWHLSFLFLPEKNLNPSLSISCVSLYRSISDEKHISVTLRRECFHIRNSERMKCSTVILLIFHWISRCFTRGGLFYKNINTGITDPTGSNRQNRFTMFTLFRESVYE